LATQSPARAIDAVSIRRAVPEDAPRCGDICYEAFHRINADHGFACEIPGAEAARGLLTRMFSHPGLECFVAEVEDRIVGSNCVDLRGPVAGIGPITVDPKAQSRGVGRALMNAVLDSAHRRQAAGIRLVQAAFNTVSMSLYASMGFEAREPLAVMNGPAIGQRMEGYTVRRATASDIDECSRLCRQVHGHDRAGELADLIKEGSAVVCEARGHITAYASTLGFFGHAVAETNLDLQALIAAAGSFAGAGMLVPIRNSVLFQWCLAHGLRVVEPMTLMTIGLYNEPRGAWLPSILC